MKKILNSNSLKIIAIFAMLLDHIAYAFLPYEGILYFVFRFVGRVCAPIMFYSLAKGYCFTKNKFKYGVRLFSFALISQIAYSLLFSNVIFNYRNYNVIVTLFLAFLSLVILENVKDKLTKCSLIFLCVILSCFCDYAIIGNVFVFIFYFFRNRPVKYVLYSVNSFLYLIIRLLIYKDILFFMIGFGLFMVLPLIYFDNGQKGKYNLKYAFYVFYPMHMLILFFLK